MPANETNLQHQTLLPPSTRLAHQSTQQIPVHQYNKKKPQCKTAQTNQIITPHCNQTQTHGTSRKNQTTPCLPLQYKTFQSKTAQTNQLGNPITTKPNHMAPATKFKPSTTPNTTTSTKMQTTKDTHLPSPHPQKGMAYHHWCHSNLKRRYCKHLHGFCHPLIPTHTTCPNSTNTTHLNIVILALLPHGLNTGSHITTLFRTPLPNNTQKN